MQGNKPLTTNWTAAGDVSFGHFFMSVRAFVVHNNTEYAMGEYPLTPWVFGVGFGGKDFEIVFTTEGNRDCFVKNQCFG